MDAVAPTVSIIIPCYNQGQYLDEAVESVLSQTWQNFEIIIVNDGSTEPDTIEILKVFNKPKATVLHTQNQGPSLARNVGITQARGQYILPLDADDKIGESYLEKAIEILDQHENVGIVCCEAEFFGEKTGKCDIPRYQFPDILVGNRIFNSSLFRKADWETVGGYNQNMVYGLEDYDFWLSIIGLGREVVQLPETLYFYRQLKGSRNEKATQNYLALCYAQIYRNHQDLYLNHTDIVFDRMVTLTEEIYQAGEQIHLAAEQLQQTQTQLQQAQTQLQQTQTQLQQTQTQLQQTQEALVLAQAQIQHTEAHVEQVRSHFQAELERTQAHVNQLSVDFEQAQNQMIAMKSSKFWKLRNLWIHVKQGIRSAGEN